MIVTRYDKERILKRSAGEWDVVLCSAKTEQDKRILLKHELMNAGEIYRQYGKEMNDQEFMQIMRVITALEKMLKRMGCPDEVIKRWLNWDQFRKKKGKIA